jgi:hypothetical protein
VLAKGVLDGKQKLARLHGKYVWFSMGPVMSKTLHTFYFKGVFMSLGMKCMAWIWKCMAGVAI